MLAVNSSLYKSPVHTRTRPPRTNPYKPPLHTRTRLKGNINGVLDPGGGTKAKERINCKYPDGKEKQPGTEHDDPGDAKEDRYLSGIYQGSTLPQRSVYEKV